MRVQLTVKNREGEHFAVVTVSADAKEEVPRLPERPVRWTAGQRLLVAKDEQLTDEDATALVKAVDAGTASPPRLKRYGMLLFEAAFGAQNWRRLVGAGHPPLELAISGHDDSLPVQSLRWEALHDGVGHVATTGAGGDGLMPVSIVRLIFHTAIFPNAARDLSPLTHIPRVLYAVGSKLTDPRVRAGAEFMGILRQMERGGGAIQPQVLESATLESLTERLERFRPDVLHVIGHGQRNSVEKRVTLQLRRESANGHGAEHVPAERLLGAMRAAGHIPRMVVLSACQTASADPLNPLSFAAELVAGGVPVVVAMAGDIWDTACRVFARALTRAISEGIPIGDAVIRGRRATFFKRSSPDSAGWQLPTVFLAEDLPAGTPLVRTDAIEAARRRCDALELSWEPVFCGRGEFVAALDRLLDADDSLNLLAAWTKPDGNSYGGMRLLRELAARAVRMGRLPILLGPYDKNPPTTLTALAQEVSLKLEDIRDSLELPHKPDGGLDEAAEAGPGSLARAMRAAFGELVADLPETDPVRRSPHPQVLLLCHRVDEWGDLPHQLLTPGKGMFRSGGLGVGQPPVPVVLTGADNADLQKARKDWCNGAAWAKFLPLSRFRADDDDPEDILAYQWWLLNPPDGIPVYAPKRGADRDMLYDLLRHEMRNVIIYEEGPLFDLAKVLDTRLLTSDTDDDILTSYDRPAP